MLNVEAMQNAFKQAQYILLDLDGTLLDKHFDDTFWLKYVPERYSAKHGVSTDAARDKLISTYRAFEQTVHWTNLDFWSEKLKLDIPALKLDLAHLIGPLPHAVDFLILAREAGKQVHLLTNAHQKSIDIKFHQTGIAGHFHSVVTSNDLGHPKEQQAFWHLAIKRVGFDPEDSLFIDDTVEVLRAAREFGVRHVFHKARSSSACAPVASEEFPSFTDFDELMNPGGR